MALTPEELPEAEALLRAKQARDRLREKEAELVAVKNALIEVGKAIDEELMGKAKTDLRLQPDGYYTNLRQGTKSVVTGGPPADRLPGPRELSSLLADYRNALKATRAH